MLGIFLAVVKVLLDRDTGSNPELECPAEGKAAARRLARAFALVKALLDRDTGSNLGFGIFSVSNSGSRCVYISIAMGLIE